MCARARVRIQSKTLQCGSHVLTFCILFVMANTTHDSSERICFPDFFHEHERFRLDGDCVSSSVSFSGDRLRLSKALFKIQKLS